MGRQVFTAGEILTAANMNDLSDQSVMVFDDASARTTAIPTPVEGMVTYLKDTDSVEKYDGSNFVGVATAPAILQVVSTTLTSTFSVSAGSFQDVTGLAATITPSSATSKVLVMVDMNGKSSTTSTFSVFAKLIRDSTDINVGDASGGDVQASSAGARGYEDSAPMSFSFLDSPATTSATTYKVAVDTNTTFMVNLGGEAGVQQGRLTSTITLMEIAG